MSDRHWQIYTMFDFGQRRRTPRNDSDRRLVYVGEDTRELAQDRSRRYMQGAHTTSAENDRAEASVVAGRGGLVRS